MLGDAPHYNASPLIPLLVVTGLSSYGLYLCYQNIMRLQIYEEQAQKAAKWSNTAAKRLNKTRATQTSGTIALGISAFTAVLLILTKLSVTPHVVLSGIGGVASVLAQIHMKSFWNEKEQVQVPLMGKFNQAVRGSEEVVQLLGGIAAAWVAAGLLAFF
ncbi:hypothetical protein N0V90_000332 [Kalmusia sp. IMI 367209]|nr:hypothetical protein N0V90_000332 [Kalmusia sp. IMI 367209]